MCTYPFTVYCSRACWRMKPTSTACPDRWRRTCCGYSAVSCSATGTVTLSTRFFLSMHVRLPMLRLSRMFYCRSRGTTTHILTTLGRYPDAESSHGSATSAPMFASTSTASGYPCDVGAGPSHVNAGKLNQHCTNIIYCTSVACANLL